MLSIEEINVLGQAINTDWGMASTERGGFPVGTAPQYSIKGSMVGDTQPEESRDLKLIVKYVTVVTYGPDAELLAQQRKFRREAEKLCRDWVDTAKKKFKEKSGRTLKAKLVDDSDSTEVIYTGSTPLSMYTQQHKQDWKRAYFRYTGIYQVS